MKSFVHRNFVPAALALLVFMLILPVVDSVISLYHYDYGKVTVTLRCQKSDDIKTMLSLEEQ